ncbi:hypothetical protein ACH5RR_033656 [Cinchona calisaya]|uniref:Uncharacterized protein n=1 Tax=Cinchona calisaya TaxID=153742 RepID=A0ABD2YD99_9GENT
MKCECRGSFPTIEKCGTFSTTIAMPNFNQAFALETDTAGRVWKGVENKVTDALSRKPQSATNMGEG